MRKLLLTALAALAALMITRAARRRAGYDAAALLWMLIWVLACPGITKNTPKANATAARVAALVGPVAAAATAAAAAQTTATSAQSTATSAQTTAVSANGRVSNLSGAQTGQVSVTGAVSDTSDPAVTGTVVFTAGVNLISSSDFTSVAGSPPHQHGFGHNHSYGHVHSHGHVHDLPTV